MIPLPAQDRWAARERTSPWSLAVAVAITAGALALLALSVTPISEWSRSDRTQAGPPRAERMVRLSLPRPAAAGAPALANAPSMSSPRTTNAPAAAGVAEAPVPRDTGSTLIEPSASAAVPRRSPLGEPSARLMPGGARGEMEGWPAPPTGRLGPPRAATPAEQDSILAARNSDVPALARARVPTQAERDAATKEAALQIHLSGRPLSTPPGGGGAGGQFRLPLFSAGPSSAERRRNEAALAENAPRMARLRQRAESLTRQRAESLFRAQAASRP